MNKLKSTPLYMIMSLGTITVLAAALLVWSFCTTRRPIADAEAEAKNDAIAEVLPKFDNSPGSEAVGITLPGETRAVTIYPASCGGRPVGAAVESYSMNGFSGEIVVLVGFDNAGTVTGYRVLSHAETPGLGSKMDEWFRDKQGHRNIIGIDMSTTHPLRVTKDGGSVDAITGATISSRAFADAVNRAYDAYHRYTAENK